MKTTSKKFVQWINGQFDAEKQPSVELISGDASFRKYYRVSQENQNWIAVDSPPAQEKNHEFIAIQKLLADAKVSVPAILASDLEQGFLLQQDLGNTQLFQVINPSNAIFYYQQAIDMMLNMQASVPCAALPKYDEQLLMQEMMLFKDWLIGTHCKIVLTPNQRADLLEVFEILMRHALKQNRRFVHRDFHSRNLMVLADDTLATIDFQDAVEGPVTYDLVSLLRDCYLVWPKPTVDMLVRYAFEGMQHRNIVQDDFETFWQDFEWMGVQRHLKASGIFCRLLHRDGKTGYIADIPRTLQYITDVASRYEALNPLAALIDLQVLPYFINKKV